MILARKYSNTTAVTAAVHITFLFQWLFYFKHTATHTWQLKAGMSWPLRSYILRYCVPFFKWPSPLGSSWLSLPLFHPSYSLPCTSCLNSNKANGSWQQRVRELVSTGASLPEGGPRQVSLRVFPYISRARQWLLAPRAHTLSCLAFDIVCFRTDGGWWTPNHCPLFIFIVPITQTLRYVFNEKTPDS